MCPWVVLELTGCHGHSPRTQVLAKRGNGGSPGVDSYEPGAGVRGDKNGPRSPTLVPRPPPDHQHRLQERPRTAHRGLKSDLRPSTQARQLHDRPSIEKCVRKASKKKHAARQLNDRPSIENIEENIHRHNMLPVNFSSDPRAICPLTISL